MQLIACKKLLSALFSLILQFWEILHLHICTGFEGMPEGNIY